MKQKYRYYIDILLIIVLVYNAFNIHRNINKKVVDKTLSYYGFDDSTYKVYYSDEIINTDSFIRKYTDKIDINFNYNLNFSDIVNGNEETLVKVELLIFAPNSESIIWKSDTEYLSPDSITSYENTTNIKANKTITVDYKKYLEMYNLFKSDTSIVSNSKIQVEFISSSIINKNILVNDTIIYEIPVSNLTYDITKKTNISNETLAQYKEIKNKELLVALLIITYITILIIFFMMILRYKNSYKAKDKYTKKLNKILKTYNNIIVNIENMPNIKNKIDVTSFNELLNAQIELRLPINFIEVKNEAKFIIIKNDLGWIYTLRKDEKK